MSLLEAVETVALLEALTPNRDPNRPQQQSYNPLRMLGAFLCFEALAEAMPALALGASALAVGAFNNPNTVSATSPMAAVSSTSAGTGQATAAAAPLAAKTRAKPTPSLGLNLSPTGPSGF